jgi:hypothetical protein
MSRRLLLLDENHQGYPANINVCPLGTLPESTACILNLPLHLPIPILKPLSPHRRTDPNIHLDLNATRFSISIGL